MDLIKGKDFRELENNVNEIFVNRWSPRAMSEEEISDEELLTLFEAARWAPSSFNEQPWRFVYSKRPSESWNKFFNALDDFNKIWCKNSSVLVCLIANKNFEKDNKPNRNHLSDSGAAWQNLALQASLTNIVAHGMAGYDLEKIRKELEIPENYEIVHLIALGKPAEKNVLPERMQKSEIPNSRKSVKEIIFKDKFTQ